MTRLDHGKITARQRGREAAYDDDAVARRARGYPRHRGPRPATTRQKVVLTRYGLRTDLSLVAAMYVLDRLADAGWRCPADVWRRYRARG